MSSTEATAPKLVDDAVRGIGFVALSYLVFSLSDASMKWALPELGTAGAMIWRGLFGTLSVAFMAGVYRPGGLARIWPNNKRIIFWRGVLNVVRRPSTTSPGGTASPWATPTRSPPPRR